MKSVLKCIFFILLFCFIVSCDKNEVDIVSYKKEKTEYVNNKVNDNIDNLLDNFKTSLYQIKNTTTLDIINSTTVKEIDEIIIVFDTNLLVLLTDNQNMILLIEHKKNSTILVNNYVDLNNYIGQTLTELTQIIDEIINNINDSSSLSEVNKVVSDGKLIIDSITPNNTAYIILNNYKESKISQINNLFNLSDYDETTIESINSLVEYSINAINNSTSLQEIDDIYNNVLIHKANFKTIKEKEIEELNLYKELKINEVNNYPDFELFFGERLEDLNTLLNNVIYQINLSTNKDMIDLFVNIFKDTYNNQVNDITNNELDLYRIEKINYVNNLFIYELYDDEEIQVIEKLVNDTIILLVNSESIEEIDSIIEDLLIEKESILTIGQKENDEFTIHKENAISHVNNFFNLQLYDDNDKEEISIIVQSAINKIKACKTTQEIDILVLEFEEYQELFQTIEDKLNAKKAQAIDFINNLFDLELYDEEDIDSITASINSFIDSINFSASISNIDTTLSLAVIYKDSVLTKEDKLNNYKSEIINSLDTLVEYAFYDTTEVDIIKDLLETAKNNILSASSSLDVDTIKENVIFEISKVITKEEKDKIIAFNNQKTKSINEINQFFDLELYDTDDQILINDLITEYLEKISLCVTIEELIEVTNSFKSKESDFLTIYEKENLLFLEKKQETMNQINSMFNLSLYDSIDVVYITGLIDKAQSDLNKALSISDIDLILSNLLNEKDSIMTKAQKEELQNHKNDTISYISTYLNLNLYDEDNLEIINDIISSFSDLISSANSIELVNAIKEDAINELNQVERKPIDVTEEKEGSIQILSKSGLNETITINFTTPLGATGVLITYVDENNNQNICDEQLIFDNYCFIVGVKHTTTYKVVLTAKYNNDLDEENQTITSVFVTAYDRSGYAHFNYSEGVGAYNNDGTLKDDAIVIYVTDENKNSIVVPNYESAGTGIGYLLNNNQYTNWYEKGIPSITKDHPVSIRIIKTVTNPLGTTAYDSTQNGGSEGDNGHMARMKNAKNLTIEGIGFDAMIYDWGIHFMADDKTLLDGGYSFEVRNLTFDDYPEDALGMEGVQAKENGVDFLKYPVERCFIHHNTFKSGYAENPAESDKAEGDGSCDFKRGRYYTLSYNYFEEGHKTSLIGASDSNLQYDITIHHNYFKNCGSRLPLVRKANVHMYNNYFLVTDDAQNISVSTDMRANSYIFSENNFYEGCKKPVLAQSGAVMKSYNNVFLSCYETNDATIVSTRDELVHNNNLYSDFDTNKNQFYYNETLKKSDVSLLTSPYEARKHAIKFAGVLKNNYEFEVPSIIPQIPTSFVEGSITLDFTTGVSQSLSTSSTTIYQNILFNVSKSYSAGSKSAITIKRSGIIFKVNTSTTFTLDGVSASYIPVLINEYGETLISCSGTITLAPGIYMIQSNNNQKEAKVNLISFN